MIRKLDVKIDNMKYDSQKTERIIENLKFFAHEGEIISILGPSGAGKSTLLRIIAGLEKRFHGRVILDERKIKKSSREIQIVFQDSRLFPWLTVRKNLEFASSGKYNDAKINKILSFVKLLNKANRLPCMLSGGEESRVAFARALIDPPKLLLLDEPFKNLDLKVKYSIIRDLTKILMIEKKIITILVTHNVEEAVLLSNKIYVVGKNPMNIKKIFKIRSKNFPRGYNDVEIKKSIAEISEYLVSDNM